MANYSISAVVLKESLYWVLLLFFSKHKIYQWEIIKIITTTTIVYIIITNIYINTIISISIG